MKWNSLFFPPHMNTSHIIFVCIRRSLITFFRTFRPSVDWLLKYVIWEYCSRRGNKKGEEVSLLYNEQNGRYNRWWESLLFIFCSVCGYFHLHGTSLLTNGRSKAGWPWKVLLLLFWTNRRAASDAFSLHFWEKKQSSGSRRFVRAEKVKHSDEMGFKGINKKYLF